MLSNRFDFLEIAHRIGMTTEVNLLPLHIIPLTYQMQILCKGCVFLSAQSDFSAALQKISQKWCLLFQVRNFLQQFRVFFIFVTQLHHNIVVDSRKHIFQPGWKDEAYEVPASWSDHPAGQHPSAGLAFHGQSCADAVHCAFLTQCINARNGMMRTYTHSDTFRFTVYRHKKRQTANDLAACRLMKLILISVFFSVINPKLSISSSRHENNIHILFHYYNKFLHSLETM